MDGRCLTVFAAAAAIGAGFYVFLAPNAKKKKGIKKGKCQVICKCYNVKILNYIKIP